MTFHTWIAFVATACIVLAIPGPTAFIVLRYAAERGPGRLTGVIAGAVLGDAVALAICTGGLGALLTASSGILTVVKAAAAAYLIVLGLATLFRRTPSRASSPRPSRPFVGVFLVTALNPKGIAFFCALLPQFVDSHAPVVPQLAILQGTFCALSLVGATGWALTGLSLRRAAEGSAAGSLARRGSGLLLIGAGVAQATGRLA